MSLSPEVLDILWMFNPDQLWIYCIVIGTASISFLISTIYLVSFQQQQPPQSVSPQNSIEEITTQKTIPTPKRSIKQRRKLLSPVAPPNSFNQSLEHDTTSDNSWDTSTDFESDVLTELDRYNSTKGEKQDIEGLSSLISASTNTQTRMNNDQFEKIQSLEQELSNQKLLNHYTEIRLTKKEKECLEIQASEKRGRNKIHELMAEIASISKTNADLMSYCEKKVASCKAEYERLSQKSMQTFHDKKCLEKELMDLKKKMNESTIYKNECSKLRANVSGFKAQIRENDTNMELLQKQIKSLTEVMQNQKQRLNDSSHHYNKVHDELVLYKQENKRIKARVVDYKDKVNELQLWNDEVMKENKEIKNQIERFSTQLKQQSLIQNEIVTIQQQLSYKKVSA